jgi:autotransporter-associated beta strand protein
MAVVCSQNRFRHILTRCLSISIFNLCKAALRRAIVTYHRIGDEIVRWSFVHIVFLSAIILVLSSPFIEAASYYWNVSNGDWSTAVNWGSTEPTSSDNAYIQNGGTVNITKTGEVCDYLYLGASGAGNSGTIEMTGGDLSAGDDQNIGYSGTGTFTQTGGTNSALGLFLGYNSGSTGTYNLSGAAQLSATYESIGSLDGTGTFTQTGGTNSISAVIFVGQNSNSTGTYNLNGLGQMSVINEYIGEYGTGTFTQTGGTNSTKAFFLGDYSVSNGTYNLSDSGQLSATTEYIGYSGTGTFKQTGGTNTITGELYLGYNSNSTGTYNLSGAGQLSADYEYIGYSGTSTFAQTGGMNSITYDLYLGFNSGYTGIYNLSDAGQLSAVDEYIGSSGTGTFTQTGGANSTLILFLGGNSGASGIYNLSGAGQLSAVVENIGSSGTGTFTQTGGINSISSTLHLGNNSGSSGTYNLKGGTLILQSLEKGDGAAAFNFGGGTLKASGIFSTSLPMTLTSDGGNANIDTAGYSAALSGVLSGTGGLNKLGSGALTLSALENFSGKTTVNNGTLVFSGGIGAQGTPLIDIESGNAVFKTTNINKSNLDIYIAASALFEVADGSHTVGDISGSGKTQVDSSASLTASSIHQATLTIGSGAIVTIQAIPGGPLANRTITTIVPELSSLVMLVQVIIGLSIYRYRKYVLLKK